MIPIGKQTYQYLLMHRDRGAVELHGTIDGFSVRGTQPGEMKT